MLSNSPSAPGMIPEPPVTGIAPTGTTDGSSRVFSLDVLRGIAVMGILVTSIWELGGFSLNKQIFFRTGTHGGNYTLLSFASILFDGKMTAIFSLVFGAGLILFLTKPHKPSSPSVPDLYIRRKLWLLILGIFTAVVLLWPGDLLYHYAVLGILLFPFRRMSSKGLLIAAVIATLIYAGKTYWNYADDRKAYKKYAEVTAIEKKFVTKDSLIKPKLDSLLAIQQADPFATRFINDPLYIRYKNDTLTKEQAKDKGAWEGIVKGLKYDSTADATANKAMRSNNYAKVWNAVLPRSQNRESYWLYQTGIWEISALMFLGMALLGFGFFDHRFSSKKYLLIATLTLITGFLLAWFRNEYWNTRLVDYAKYIDKNSIPYNQFFPFEKILLATGYASITMLLLRLNIFGWLKRSLEAVGRMAFTNYFLQVIACTLFFYGYGMGYFGRLSQAQLYFVVAEMCLAQIAFSIIWLRFFTMGPVEWLWRCLIYWKAIPVKKKQTNTVIAGPTPSIT
jgi:uncharacterized protein